MSPMTMPMKNMCYNRTSAYHKLSPRFIPSQTKRNKEKKKSDRIAEVRRDKKK